jgi:Zn-dependent peptidase ImmA (M78 family)
MADDYLVKERSNNECSDLAKRARTWFGQSDAQYLDICECLTIGKVWTVYGVRPLILKIRPDEEMGKDDAVTIYADGVITITVKQSCWDGAKQKQVRPRQTLAHELGHAVQGHAEMRFDKPMARREGAVGKYISERQRPSQYKSAEGLPASKSAEHQAKVFAPAFLINDKIAETLSGAQEIALAFGLSLESAKIYFDQLVKKRDRKKSAERVRRSANETIAILRSAARPQPTYLRDPCICGMRTLRWEGTKVRCSSCGFFGDWFQDGDKAG